MLKFMYFLFDSFENIFTGFYNFLVNIDKDAYYEVCTELSYFLKSLINLYAETFNKAASKLRDNKQKAKCNIELLVKVLDRTSQKYHKLLMDLFSIHLSILTMI